MKKTKLKRVSNEFEDLYKKIYTKYNIPFTTFTKLAQVFILKNFNDFENLLKKQKRKRKRFFEIVEIY